MLDNLIAELQREANAEAAKLANARAESERKIFTVLLASTGRELTPAEEKSVRKAMTTAGIDAERLKSMGELVDRLLRAEQLASELDSREAAHRAAVEAAAQHRGETERLAAREKAEIRIDVNTSQIGAGAAGDRLAALQHKLNERAHAQDSIEAEVNRALALVDQARAAAAEMVAIYNANPELREARSAAEPVAAN